MATNADPIVDCDILDLGLAEQGKRRIEWAFQSMPVLQAIRKQFIRMQPLAGYRIAACLPVTPESANLMVTLRDGGAQTVLCAADSFSTRDDVAACLVKDYGIRVYAIHGEAPDLAAQRRQAALATEPQWLLDHAGHLLRQVPAGVLGATAETRRGPFGFPLIAVDQAQTTHLFDHRHGAGQSILDGILRSTNLLLSGLTVVVAGYGWCGRGIATRARGMGANVIVTEIEPIRALEALMDGNRVLSMPDAAALGDLIITATGNKNVIGRESIDRLKSGAIIANAGHAAAEVDLAALERTASSHRPIRDLVEEYVLRDGRRVYVLAAGLPVNAAAAGGQPAAVRDISLANHALALEYLTKHHLQLEHRVHPVPEEIDRQVARLKLDSLGMKIDRLTPEQEAYLASWTEAN